MLRLAREQLRVGGPTALSVRAVARDLGMVSSAIYRYVRDRDELLTRLIIDGYERLGEALETADASVQRRSDLHARWDAVVMALRKWALDDPSEWALLFGTPVPDYAAPQDTIGPATRYTAVMVALLARVSATGRRVDVAVPPSLGGDLRRLRETFGLDVDDATLAAGLHAWAAVMGALNLELFGHLHKVVDEPGALLRTVAQHHAEVLFGPRPGRRR